MPVPVLRRMRLAVQNRALGIPLALCALFAAGLCVGLSPMVHVESEAPDLAAIMAPGCIAPASGPRRPLNETRGRDTAAPAATVTH